MPESENAPQTESEKELTWRRMLADLLRPTRAQALMALILCLCSLGIVWQIRSRGADDTYAGMRRSELVQILDQLNGNANKLRADIATEEAAKRKLQSGVDSRKVAEEQAKARLSELQVLAGTAAATGPGVTITLTDPQGKVTGSLLLDAVEEMRDAGAEAIDVNGQRVVASTWFGGAGSEVVVSGTAIRAPYVLTVIGDSHALEEGARFRGGLVSQAQAPQVGASVTIVASQNLTIRSLHTPQPPTFAKPTKR